MENINNRSTHLASKLDSVNLIYMKKIKSSPELNENKIKRNKSLAKRLKSIGSKSKKDEPFLESLSIKEEVMLGIRPKKEEMILGIKPKRQETIIGTKDDFNSEINKVILE
ncbi:hypothetical protein AYI70_g2476 [Smittium culicis]|uniref:Uncharacterized protein n=1 Tax=Smittium culicis TaxID=133412 RepID=A0A1R1Y887_9FUNG|nr:hypothetical protein AYI70_g2476 [Smittium culicis]